MRKAIVKVTVLVQLDIDTDRDVIKLEDSVLHSIRQNIEDALENTSWSGKGYDTRTVALGHYVDSIAVPFIRWDK